MSEAAIAFAKANGGRFVEELKELLRIPSISTTPERAGDVRRAAEFVAEGLRKAGMENVRLIETSTDEADGASAGVCGVVGCGPGKPTVLCYGHYDVQPPDPLDEWKSPPFEPDGARWEHLCARGGRRQGTDVDACEGAGVGAGEWRASCR